MFVGVGCANRNKCHLAKRVSLSKLFIFVEHNPYKLAYGRIFLLKTGATSSTYHKDFKRSLSILAKALT